jgi:putative MFS transporter
MNESQKNAGNNMNEENIKTMEIGTIINKTGVGKFQKKMLAICGITWAFNAMEIMIIAFILPVVTFAWNLKPHEAGLIGTSIFVGMLIGAWFWGTASDYIGRKKTFLATVFFFSVFTFAGAFIPPDFLVLAFLRALAGFGVGGMLPVVSTLLSEYVPTKKRGKYLVYLESFWILGTLLAAFLAWYIIPTFGWRMLFAIGGLPIIMMFFIYKFVPESPRYLVLCGDKDKACDIVKGIARENEVNLQFDSIKSIERTSKITVSRLWHRDFARTTTMLWIAWFFLTLSNYGVLIWLPTYFYRTMSFSIGLIYTFVILSSLGQVPGYLVAIFSIERLGRKMVTGIFIILSAVFAFFFAISTSTEQLVISATLVNFSLAASWSGMYAYTPELYPTEARSTGMGWASGMGRIGATIGPMLGALLMPISITVTLTAFAACFSISGISVLILGYETKGRELQDIVDDKIKAPIITQG